MTTTLFDLKGRRALITGASGGLGLHFAETLGRAGAEVVLAARRADKLADEVARLRATGISAHAVSLDVTSAASVTQAVAEAEKFAGALRTYSIEAMMQDGKALQACTSHYLGQNFGKAFDVQFLNKNNEKEHAYATSRGLSTRAMGGVIMSHSDDK